MAQSRDSQVFDPSSPRSSCGGADSFKSTPDTRLTAFSPDENSVKHSRITTPLDLGLSGAKPIQFLGSASGSTISVGDKDPFVTVYPRTTTASQLSPTASTFHPFLSLSNLSDSLAGALPVSEGLSVAIPAATLGNESGPSQCVQISSPNQALSLGDVAPYLAKLECLGVLEHGPRHIVCRAGKAYIRFNDTYSATVVYDNMCRAQVVCEASYVSEAQWLKYTAAVGSSASHVSISAFSAIPGSLDVSRAEAIILQLLQSQGEVLAYRRLQQSPGLTVYAASAEYARLVDAYAAVAAYSGRLVEDIVIHLSVPRGQETSSPAVVRSGTASLSALSSPERDLAQSMQELSFAKAMPAMQLMASQQAAPALVAGQQYPSTGFQFQQPYSVWPIFCHSQLQQNMASYVLDSGPQGAASSRPLANNYRIMAPVVTEAGNSQMVTMSDDYCQPRTMPGYHRPDGRRQNASRVNRSSPYGAASHHNHVDVGRIREGTDVRTTIMLRNIPNKVDQAMLKRIVDESSWGKYDFMYLRIDFANDCNVGYAFINFVDPLDIIDFVNARGNQRWNCFKSDKVAEISYATIQGKDCLVQKFRNSSVMLEAAHYRPKLFYTSNGPMPELAGQEEPFPEPDNQSKMKRSCENAEHVGLFTPNAGQHFRDEQRRRRSQYDRGTRLAALEEHDLETAIQPYMHYSQ